MKLGDLVRTIKLLGEGKFRLYESLEPQRPRGTLDSTEIAIVIEVKQQENGKNPRFVRIISSTGTIGWISILHIDTLENWESNA